MSIFKAKQPKVLLTNDNVKKTFKCHQNTKKSVGISTKRQTKAGVSGSVIIIYVIISHHKDYGDVLVI